MLLFKTRGYTPTYSFRRCVTNAVGETACDRLPMQNGDGHCVHPPSVNQSTHVTLEVHPEHNLASYLWKTRKVLL